MDIRALSFIIIVQLALLNQVFGGGIDTALVHNDSIAIITKDKSSNSPITIVKVESNSSEKKGWIENWLPLITALLVSLFAYRSVIKQSKASTVSTFRVKWIEDLRQSYSEFLVALRNVGDKIRSGQLNLSQYRKDEDAEKLQLLQTKIKLLLNHNKETNPEHSEFWDKLLTYIEQHHQYYRGPYSEVTEQLLDRQRIEIEEVLLVIFKDEWEKAKNFN